MPNTLDSANWLHGHAHDPNPRPPSADATLFFQYENEPEITLSVEELRHYPQALVEGCYIVSTGHGTTGPFNFGGVQLRDLVIACLPIGAVWDHVDVISADNFGTRIRAGELLADPGLHPILLAYQLDGKPLTREQGLVRLVVPSETDDALRQVKWVARVEVGESSV